MLPNWIVLIEVLLVYHTRTTSPLWRPYYNQYPRTVTDRVQFYRLAYVIQKYALSVILISFCVYHTNVPGYHNHLCNPFTNTKCTHCTYKKSLCNVGTFNWFGVHIVTSRRQPRLWAIWAIKLDQEDPWHLLNGRQHIKDTQKHLLNVNQAAETRFYGVLISFCFSIWVSFDRGFAISTTAILNLHRSTSLKAVDAS